MKPAKDDRLDRKGLKVRTFSQRHPSKVSSISDALAIKSDEPFLLVQPDGNVPAGRDRGLGLYFRDNRFLDCWDVRINGAALVPLMASASVDVAAVHELSNSVITSPGQTTIPELSLRARIEWVLANEPDQPSAGLYWLLTMTSFDPEPTDIELTIRFGSRFQDVFEVRELVPPQPRRLIKHRVNPSSVILASHGVDGLWRSTGIRFSPEPSSLSDTQAVFHIHLAPEESTSRSIGITALVSSEPPAECPDVRLRESLGALRTARVAEREEWLSGRLQVTTDNRLLNQVLVQSFSDLAMLRTKLLGKEFFAAGLPWFGALFGRDSIITAIQTLAYDNTIAERTLRLLASYQGTVVNEWRSEQPGKILHELRVGALARADRVPSPYYGSVDATPLFLILVAEHYAWAGDPKLFLDLRPNVEAALRWIDVYGDSDGDGFVDYYSTEQYGFLVNQGWKDSGDAIVNADGSLATPPIALVEVQGYVYLAKRKIADLFEVTGEPQVAKRLRQEAEALRKRFNERFWLPKEGIYAMALQKDGKPCAVMSSNPGQALWGEIVADEHGPEVARRLLDETMFSGWGIRTLAASERRYNPVGYHLGTVWPHDNSLIAAGLRKYHFDREAERVFSGIFEAANSFALHRLPELFAGFGRSSLEFPSEYPVACHPQAWAAGSIPFFLYTSLGLEADAPSRRLTIVRPMLPSWVDHVLLRGLQVGTGTVDLEFSRAHPTVRVTVAKRSGDLQVNVLDHALNKQRSVTAGSPSP